MAPYEENKGIRIPYKENQVIRICRPRRLYQGQFGAKYWIKTVSAGVVSIVSADDRWPEDAVSQQAITWSNDDREPCRHMASSDHNTLEVFHTRGTKHAMLTHCSLVMPCGDIYLGQHWLK